MLHTVRMDEWLFYWALGMFLFWFVFLGSNTTEGNNFFTIKYRIFEIKKVDF